MTGASQVLAQAAFGTGDKRIASLSESRALIQDVTTSSNVTGLIGVQSDYWTAKDGTVYVNARMNRRECAARYSAMINENDGVIRLLKEDAERNSGTFDAYESLNFAVNAAVVTDNLQGILEVIDPSATSRRPAYGNADAVRMLVQNAARAVVITVKVDGDENSRISRAFAAYFTQKGFRTNTSGLNSYLLSAVLKLENVDLPNQNNKYVRYLLTAAIADNAGKEVFSYSRNDREGHISESEARQRALRAAEAAIGSAGFAKEFDAYLESLLK
ncbi:hypothetical protein FACS189442_5350 [Spirochaetia bacterium]|nr:hypothetical protein FACS189442_5350 [Spirochaetia bacterium]